MMGATAKLRMRKSFCRNLRKFRENWIEDCYLDNIKRNKIYASSAKLKYFRYKKFKKALAARRLRTPYLPWSAETPTRTEQEHNHAIERLCQKNANYIQTTEYDWGEPSATVTDPVQIILLNILWGVQKNYPKPTMKRPPPLKFFFTDLQTLEDIL